MKIRIKKLPKARKGLFANMPFAGALPLNPFGLINSDTSNLDKTYNESVKGIDRNEANIEAEKGEVLFKFDKGGVFKIAGKKHSEGGTPIKAETGDFIFSNDKSLAINKKEADTFNLKFSGSGKKFNTPAKVLSKEIDLKKYNKFLTVLQDPNADVIAKTTAQIMLNKYMEKIGQIGYLQEAKKDFPQGMPGFAQGSAPVYSSDIINAQQQAIMFKFGGTVLPQAAQGFFVPPTGSDPIDPYKGGKTKAGATTPKGYNNAYNRGQSYLNEWERLIPGISGWENKKAQGAIYDYMVQNDPNEVANMWNTYGMTAKGIKLGFDPKFQASSENVAKLRDAYVDGFFGVRQLETPPRARTTNIPERQRPGIPEFHTNINIPENVQPNELRNVPEVPFQGFNIGMNSMEVLSGITPYLSALAQPTYYDMLTQKYSPNIRLDRLNNTNEINAIQSQSSLAQRELANNMPGQSAYLAAGDVRGNEIANMMRSNNALGNANTQIANQESMINYQTDQQDNMFNLQNVHQTYNNNVLARQRRNEQLTNGAIGSMSNFMAIQNNLDTLNQQATAAVLPYLSSVDATDENGNPIKVQMPPVTFNKNRMPVPTGFGSFNSFGVQSLANTPDSGDYKSAYEYFLQKGVTPDKAAQAATIIFYGRSGQKNAGQYNASNPYAAMMSGLYHF